MPRGEGKQNRRRLLVVPEDGQQARHTNFTLLHVWWLAGGQDSHFNAVGALSGCLDGKRLLLQRPESSDFDRVRNGVVGNVQRGNILYVVNLGAAGGISLFANNRLDVATEALQRLKRLEILKSSGRREALGGQLNKGLWRGDRNGNRLVVDSLTKHGLGGACVTYLGVGAIQAPKNARDKGAKTGTSV